MKTELTDVFINAGQARAFRAPGHPQGAWALEQMMDQLAEKIGMDPVEFRVKNVPAVSQATATTRPTRRPASRRACEEGAKRFGWREARKRPAGRRRRSGAASAWRPACGSGGDGGPPATIIVKLFADGSVNLNMGASDIGTGTKTVMAMVVAEELGVPLDRIQVEWADTGTTQYATRERRQQDGADRVAGRAGGGARRQAAAAGAWRRTQLKVRRQETRAQGTARSSRPPTRRRRWR